MSELYQQILKAFEAEANPAQAKPMTDYMRGRFEYFGIKSPQRKEIQKQFHGKLKKLSKEEVLELVQLLWKQPKRELHYTAQEYLFRCKKMINEEEDIDFLQWLIITKSWWDTVDFVAPKLIKIYFEKYPEKRDEKVNEWVASDNIWLNRTAILIHLHQKDKVDLPFMFQTILRLNDTKEFFVDKAIGWVLREHAKRVPQEIQDFVSEHQDQLSALSIREGLKHFK